MNWEHQTYDRQLRTAKVKEMFNFASVSKRHDMILWSSRDLTSWPQRKSLHFSLDSSQYGSQSWRWTRKRTAQRRADEEHSSSQQPQNGSGKQNILGWQTDRHYNQNIQFLLSPAFCLNATTHWSYCILCINPSALRLRWSHLFINPSFDQ